MIRRYLPEYFQTWQWKTKEESTSDCTLSIRSNQPLLIPFRSVNELCDLKQITRKSRPTVENEISEISSIFTGYSLPSAGTQPIGLESAGCTGHWQVLLLGSATMELSVAQPWMRALERHCLHTKLVMEYSTLLSDIDTRYALRKLVQYLLPSRRFSVVVQQARLNRHRCVPKQEACITSVLVK